MQLLLPGMHHSSWQGRDTLASLIGGLKCHGVLRGLEEQFDIMLLWQVSGAWCWVVMGHLQSREGLETLGTEEIP